MPTEDQPRARPTIGMRDIVYVRLTSDRDGRNLNTEYRITEAEDRPGQLEIGVYTWNTGSELSTRLLTREAAAILRSALASPSDGVRVPLDYASIREHDVRNRRWIETELRGEPALLASSSTQGARIELVASGESVTTERMDAEGMTTLLGALHQWEVQVGVGGSQP